MKRLITLILVSLAIPPIYAGGAVDTPFLNSGPYVGLHGGVALPSESDLNAGPVVGAQVGYRMGNVRIEGALSYYSNSLEANSDAKLRMTTLMANGYYDFNFNAPLVPFVGVGVGWVHAWRTNNGVLLNRGTDNNEFAYQGIAGVSFRVSPRVTLGVDYRYLGWTDGNGSQNLIEMSVNYQF
ncbi:porin family protein [Coxiella burnetii]|uniref:Heat resistant agglutinin n=1 Tax=Coxiella burnetii (strain Dugway 5J108-111) TaxID=434922 RepID=A9KDN8_COXBN|nr:outer membrane beta-barrel protein [Coxiella burnetii]ABS78368.1 heat resistant agglutinin [Coxiella burnetii Dugway 5J108-111]OYK80861.1 porin family protein [Coxiella burnetii]OYK82948.1 porin family protein [Coxiella burnetii]